MKILLISIITLLIIQTYQTTSSFGLLTVTHSRQGDYSILQKYLKNYAETDCYTKFISQINLVWNNQQPPEETSILNRKSNWKIPVFFHKTTFNSMDHRYRLPKQSTAQLLYSLDDDINVDCETFELTLKEYEKVGNGKLGRIITNQVRGFKFQPSAVVNNEFYYQGQANTHFFTISEPGAAFIPRHYLQLYYLKIAELTQLRNEILEVKNCDDIFFYAVAQHFYPQLPAAYVAGLKGYKNTDPKIGQSKVQNVYQTRSNCITDISKIFGYNPLRFFGKNSSQLLNNWKYQNLETILQLRIKGFSEVQLQKAVQKTAQQYFSQKKKKQEKQVSQQKVKQDISQTPVVNQLIKQKQQKKIDQQKIIIEKKPQQIQSQTQASQTSNQTKDKPLYIVTTQNNQFDSEIKDQKVKNQKISIKLTFEEQLVIYVLLIGILVIICIKLLKKNCSKKTKYRIRLNQEQESQFSSIRLPDRY